MLPATIEGVRAVVELLDPDTDPGGRQWTAIRGRGPTKVGESVGESLQKSLSPAAFMWLCACSVYPELHWGLTLRLAQLPALGNEVLNEANILQLVRLPWFRGGRMPDDLRLELMQRLPRPVEEEVRAELVRLLSAHPAPEASVAGEDQNVQLALQRFLSSVHDRSARREAKRELRRFPEEAVARDRATTSLLQARAQSPLQIQIPETLRRRLYSGGIRVLGLRTAARAAVAVLFALVAIAAIEIPGDGGLFAAARSLPPENCSVFGTDYNRNGGCFDEPPALIDSPIVPLTPSFATAPTSTRLAVHVDEAGQPIDVATTGPSDAAEFDRLAREQALASAYAPATRGSQAVSAWVEEVFEPGTLVAVAGAGVVDSLTPEAVLRLTQTSLTLFPDETASLTDLVADGGPDPASVAWRSLTPDIAQIDAAGRVRSIQQGSATLEASTDGGQVQTLALTVELAAVAVSQTEVFLTPGTQTLVEVEIAGSGERLTRDRISWTSNDDGIVTVDADGQLTAVDVGVTDVVVATPIGERTIGVTVHPPIRALGVDPGSDETVMLALGGQRVFQAFALTEDNRAVLSVPIEFEVEDPSIVSFDPVTMSARGLATGTTRVIARSRDGSVSAGWTVDVVAASLRATAEVVNLALGDVVRVEAALVIEGEPNSATTSASWQTHDASVVTVTADGSLTGRGWGRTSVVTSDASGRADTVAVAVWPIGTYAYNGLMSGSYSAGTTSDNVSGSVQFGLSGGEFVATACGQTRRLSDPVTSVGFDCGYSLRFRVTHPNVIVGNVERITYESVPIRRTAPPVCAAYDTDGNCVRYVVPVQTYRSEEVRMIGTVRFQRIPGSD